MIIEEYCDNPITIKNTKFPCGKCRKCINKKIYEWTERCLEETIMQKEAVTITLTYNSKNLKKIEGIPTLKKEDITKYLKRLRKKLGKKKIKYIIGGEYGEKKGRPHYHMVIWGLNAKNFINISGTSSKEEEKKGWIIKEKIWKMGKIFVSKKEVTDKTINYIIFYILKQQKDKNFQKLIEDAGIENVFKRQSQGIGQNWAKKNENVIKTKIKNGQSVKRAYIQKIFKREGRTVKIKKGDKNYYKVFKNPKGEITSLYNKKQIEKAEEKEWEEDYRKLNYNENEIQEKRENKIKRVKKIIEREKYVWEIIKKKTDKEVAEWWQNRWFKNEQEEREGIKTEKDKEIDIQNKERWKKLEAIRGTDKLENIIEEEDYNVSRETL